LILVVGATGQLGLALVRRLRQRGEQVSALVRPFTDAAAVRATGARIVHGDLREPAGLAAACEGVDTVVATANAIVPRRGEHPDYAALAEGYAQLGRSALASGSKRFLLVSVPRELMGRGAPEFDSRKKLEASLAAAGPPLTIARCSLFMEVWLPYLGSRLALRGSEQATIERGFWFGRLAGATTQRSLDYLGIALLPGDGTARHSFVAIDDVAQALAAAAGDQGLGDELHLGGPEALSWREAADLHARVLERRVRAVRQPAPVFRALSTVFRRLSPGASQLLAAAALAGTIDLVYPPDDARRYLQRDPISVEAFLRRRLAVCP
jgi:uncharacterized protein YbjT (DUF2867 family)